MEKIRSINEKPGECVKKIKEKPEMRKKIIGVGIALIVLVGFLYILPLNGIYGTYVNIGRPSYYIEIKRDGTFTQYIYGSSITGTWERDNNRIRFDVFGRVTRGRIIEDDRIITPCPFRGREIIWERR